MQYLTRCPAPDSQDPQSPASFYEIRGDYQSKVERYIVSTPWSRDICNKPELLGYDYTSSLRSAVTAALANAPFRERIGQHPEHRVCVLNFLRGGLNFGLRDALHAAYGLNTHSSAFMSSQRFRIDGRWQVKEDMYRKLRIPSEALILTGDVVATGVTLSNGLQVLLDHLVNIGSSLRGLIFFTIGCHKLEKYLAEFDDKFRQAFPKTYQGCCAIYLEGKFRLVDSKTELLIGLPGTDLIRRDCLLAPEMELSQYEAVSHALERCTIYDAGSRSFDIKGYLNDVIGYWRQVEELARGGLTLRQALAERWPEREYTSAAELRAIKGERWQGVDAQQLDALHRCYQQRWTEPFQSAAETSEALLAVCRERLATLESILAPRHEEKTGA